MSVKPVHVQLCFQLPPHGRFRSSPAPHVSVHRHRAPQTSTFEEEFRCNTQRIGKAPEDLCIRGPEISLIARQRRLCDAGDLREFSLRETAGSAGGGQYITELTHGPSSALRCLQPYRSPSRFPVQTESGTENP